MAQVTDFSVLCFFNCKDKCLQLILKDADYRWRTEQEKFKVYKLIVCNSNVSLKIQQSSDEVHILEFIVWDKNGESKEPAKSKEAHSQMRNQFRYIFTLFYFFIKWVYP